MSTQATRMKAQREAKKDSIVLAACAHVTFDGWSERALIAGAEDAGFDADTAKRLFPDGAVDAIAHLKKLADRKMVEELHKLDVANMRIRERILTAVRLRLEFLTPYKEAVRKGMSILILPQHAILTTKLTAETVDEIWHQAGDTSHDYNWYTKRATLGAVYSATVLYWLADDSENAEDTWDFLARRLDDAVKIGPLKNKVLSALNGLPERFNRLAAGMPRPGL